MSIVANDGRVYTASKNSYRHRGVSRRVCHLSAHRGSGGSSSHTIKHLCPTNTTASAATSLATLDDFVPVMLEAEDENYNLFKLINELNKEVGDSIIVAGSICLVVHCLVQYYWPAKIPLIPQLGSSYTTLLYFEVHQRRTRNVGGEKHPRTPR